MKIRADMLRDWKMMSRVRLVLLFVIFSVGFVTASSFIQHKRTVPQLPLGAVAAEGTQSSGVNAGRGSDVNGFGILGSRRLMAPYSRFRQFPTHNSDDPTLQSLRYAASTDESGLHKADPYFTHEFQKESRRLASENPDVVHGGFSVDYAQAGMSKTVIQDPPAIPRTADMEVDYDYPHIHPPCASDDPHC